MNFLLTLAIVTTLQQPIDATALTFTVERDSITVRVGRWKLRATKAMDLNRFVDAHLKEIDPAKIIIYGDRNAKYNTFQAVIEVLKKHDWMKFRLEDPGPKAKQAPPKLETREG